MHRFFHIFIVFVIAFFGFIDVAHAYLDPGTGSVLFSTIIAVVGAIAYSLKSLYYKLLGKKGSSGFEVGDDTLVIFSEGKSYWGTFRPLVEELIKQKIHFRYISMELHDPALTISSDYMHARLYPKNKWSFEKLAKIKTPVMLATTPNIGSPDYPMVKSSRIGDLVHVFHAMSATSNYRLGGLDHYDSVILVGPHQEDNLRTIEKIRGIPTKQMVALGLPYLDDLLTHRPNLPNQTSRRKTILIAPSWGVKGCLNEYGTDFIRDLAKGDYNLIIRLHPHSKLYEPDNVARWKKKLAGLENLSWDNDVFAHNTMAASDLLISDTSSIRFDYAFLYLKPVITLDIPRESREDFEAVYFETTWSETSSNIIGTTLNRESIKELPHKVEHMLQRNLADEIRVFRDKTVSNFGCSARHIISYVNKKVENAKC